MASLESHLTFSSEDADRRDGSKRSSMGSKRSSTFKESPEERQLRRSSKIKLRPPPTLVEALCSKGAKRLASFLALREGVRLAFVSRGFDRVQIQRVAIEYCIAASDLVPVRVEMVKRQELLCLAIHHLSHCWGCALRVLDLSGCDFLRDYQIQSLFSGLWELLLDLRLVDCRLLSDLCVKSVAEACHYLKALHLSGLDLLTEASMTYVANNCSRLQQLYIGRCARIPDDGLETVFAGCHQLQLLDAHGNQLITDASLSALARGCPQLHALNLQKCLRLTDSGFQRMAETIQQLQQLNISDDRLSDWGIRPLIESSKQMQVIKMRRCGSDVTLCSVALRCNQLLRLDVSDCYHSVTDVGLQVVNEGCPLLIEFSAENCVLITGVGVEALAMGCRNLRFVNLAGCADVGDIGIVGLGTSCPRLEQLNLSRCNLISDLGVSAIGEGCQLLMGLVLSFCRHVTDVGIESLAHGCPKLEDLNLFECSNVTDRGLVAFSSYGRKFKSLQTEGCDLKEPIPNLIIEEVQESLPEEADENEQFEEKVFSYAERDALPEWMASLETELWHVAEKPQLFDCNGQEVSPEAEDELAENRWPMTVKVKLVKANENEKNEEKVLYSHAELYALREWLLSLETEVWHMAEEPTLFDCNGQELSPEAADELAENRWPITVKVKLVKANENEKIEEKVLYSYAERDALPEWFLSLDTEVWQMAEEPKLFDCNGQELSPEVADELAENRLPMTVKVKLVKAQEQHAV